MAFTGTPVLKEVADGLMRITGVSLLAGASATIGLHESTLPPDIRLPSEFQPRRYGYDKENTVELQDSIQVYFNYLVPGAVVPPIAINKAGTNPRDFLILFANASAGAGSLLGAAAPFGVLGASTVTNTGNTVITGSLGLFPGTSIVGFPPGTATSTHDTDATAHAAQDAAQAAFLAFQALTPTANLTGQDLGGLTLLPGVYKFDTSAQLTGTLTLDAAGDANAVWVFQIGSTLTTASASDIDLINGALAGNVYWAVGSSATLGTTTDFVGSIIAQASVTLDTGASMVQGRAIALVGAVTLDTNAITVPSAGGTPAPASSGPLEIYVRFH